MGRILSVVAVFGVLALAFAGPAHAATFQVNSTADEPDANPVNNDPCATLGGACTLRAAIDQANANNTPSTINLPAGTYTLTGAPGEDLNASGDLDVSSAGSAITIVGAGARSTIIDGDQLDRVFHLLIRSNLTVRGVTITGGLADDALSDGGGIFMDENSSALVVIDSTIRDNTASETVFGGVNIGGDGGGIHTGEGSQVSISGTTIANNTAVEDGGAIENDAASLSITNSTINGNRALGTPTRLPPVTASETAAASSTTRARCRSCTRRSPITSRPTTAGA